MASYFFNYGMIFGRAMQRVVHGVLSYVAEHSLPGKHHFYITFSTRAEGVIMPQKVLMRYPEQITIVLQHEFYDLNVKEDCFEVTLVFDGVREKIVVPFDALLEFSDPYANFSMQFEVGEWSSQGLYDDNDDEDGDLADDDDEGATINLIAERERITRNLTSRLFSSFKKSTGNSDHGDGEQDKEQIKGNVIFIDEYLDRNG